MPYGIVPTGFIVKPLDVCLSELEALFRATFGAGLSLDPSTPDGQLVGLLAGREASLWGMAQAVYANRDPRQASGAGLEAVCALTGIVRQAATRSSVTLTLAGSPSLSIPDGALVSVTTTGAKFRTKAPVTLDSGGAGTVAMEAVDPGPVTAPAGTLTVIETPISGWTSATNAADAIPGALQETDAALRQRREAALAAGGAATVEAMRSALLKLAGVASATVFENRTLDVDGLGRPPKSVEAIVQGGTNEEIAATVWRTKPAGIEPYGTSSISVVDSQGHLQAVGFSRPSSVPVYVVANILVDASAFDAAGGPGSIAAAMAAWAVANLQAGSDVVSFQLKRTIAEPGVLDVVSLYIGTAAGPTSETKIGMSARQLPQVDPTRITVNVATFPDTP